VQNFARGLIVLIVHQLFIYKGWTRALRVSFARAKKVKISAPHIKRREKERVIRISMLACYALHMLIKTEKKF
jgi:hypothetical protein